MVPAKLMQSRSKFLCVGFLGLHHGQVLLAHAMLHLAMYKFVIRLMAHYHAEIQPASDGGQLNRILEATEDKSVNQMLVI